MDPVNIMAVLPNMLWSLRAADRARVVGFVGLMVAKPASLNEFGDCRVGVESNAGPENRISGGAEPQYVEFHVVAMSRVRLLDLNAGSMPSAGPMCGEEHLETATRAHL